MARLFNKTRWPTPNAEIEAALGRFIIAWSVLEQQMDFAINELNGLDHDLASAVTANLGTKAKIDMYQAMAHCMKDVVGSDLVEEGNSLSGATANASGELRNFLFHGQPFILALTSGEHEIWAKFAARKGGVQARIVGLTPKYIDAQTATVKEIIERWQSIRERSFKELAIWDRMPADLREDGGDEGS